jgi:hypothetical protein
VNDDIERPDIERLLAGLFGSPAFDKAIDDAISIERAELVANNPWLTDAGIWILERVEWRHSPLNGWFGSRIRHNPRGPILFPCS